MTFGVFIHRSDSIYDDSPAERYQFPPQYLGRVQNGLALSGTVHWMFDRGLIGLSDDLDILVSRQVNDRVGGEAMINRTGRALAPVRAGDRPHPHFLAWHRSEVFKQ